MGNLKANISKVALALVLLVAISIYFVFFIYYTSLHYTLQSYKKYLTYKNKKIKIKKRII